MSGRLLTVDDALGLSAVETAHLYEKYGNRALKDVLQLLGMDKTYTTDGGSWVRDDAGNRILDFTGGFGANPFGHDTKVIRAEVERVSEIVPNILQTALSKMQAGLHQNLAMISPGGMLPRSIILNTGADAVEAALKLARIATGRTKLVSTEKGFHGKTMGALSVTAKRAYQKPFEPLIPHCETVPFGDHVAVWEALQGHDVAAVIVEPVQGEGGVRVPYDGYLADVKDACRKTGTLLILDEVQTGIGRTGKMFACEHDGIIPDILCVAKGLGGGVEAVAAIMTTDAIMSVYWKLSTFALHTSTMGGRARACAAAMATLALIHQMRLCEAVEERGAFLLEGLKKLQVKYPHVIRDVRGKGLLIGVELGHIMATLIDLVSHDTGSQLLGSLIAGKLLNEQQALTVYTLNQPRVLRVEPALTVTEEECQFFLAALDRVLAEYRGFQSLLAHGLGRPDKLALVSRLMTGK